MFYRLTLISLTITVVLTLIAVTTEIEALDFIALFAALVTLMIHIIDVIQAGVMVRKKEPN